MVVACIAINGAYLNGFAMVAEDGNLRSKKIN